MELETMYGVPCIAIGAGERLADYQLYLSGLKINNGFLRYTEKLTGNENLEDDESDSESLYLILIPDYFRDSKDDLYSVAVERIGESSSNVAREYSWSDKLRVSRSRRGNVDESNQQSIRGWYRNSLNPEANALSVYINGVFVGDATANRPRQDVADSLGDEYLHTGFDYQWPKGHQVHSIELRERVSGLTVLNTPVEVFNRQHTICDLENMLRSARLNGDDLHFSQTSLNLMFNAIRRAPPESTLLKGSSFRPPLARDSGTTVIIPAYNSANELMDCVDSLILSADSSKHEILIVNDASPDNTVRTYLKEKQLTHSEIYVIESEINRGFVKSVNKALLARRYNDVILLNSDTIVPEKFIDRMTNVSNDNPAFGIITPLSNNATIFSFPKTLEANLLPDSDGLKSIDTLLQSEGPAQPIKVPTAHGYCMFVTGEAIESVGELNAKEWGIGYGEENDYCQRVKMAGWSIGAYYGMFVGHVGSTSFGEATKELQIQKNLNRLNELYPEYDGLIQHYITNDNQGRLCRNTLQLKYVKQLASENAQDILLHASHSLGGGTEEYIKRSAQELSVDSIYTLKLWNEGSDYLVIGNTDETIKCIYTQSDKEVDRLCEDLAGINLLDIVLNSSFNFPERLLNGLCSLNIPYTVVIHDFSWMCPKINMIDARGSFCGMPETKVCQTCIEVSGTPYSLATDWKKNSHNIEEWIRKNSNLLMDARVVICPSQDTARRMNKKFPDIKTIVKYHSDGFPVPVVAQSNKSISVDDGIEYQKIAVFGRIGQHKGMAVLKNLIWLLSSRHPGVEIIFFGELAEYSWLDGYKNVSFVGEYKQESLSGMITQYQPTMALFLSVWPETYCYALTDAIRNGIFPIVFDIGAFRERVEMHNFGGTIPFSSDSETIYDSLIKLIKYRNYVSSDVESIENGATYRSFLRENMEIYTD